MTTVLERTAELRPWAAYRPAAATPPRLSADHPNRKTLLESIVLAEILPRLGRPKLPTPIPPTTTDDDTLALVHLLLTGESADAVAFIDRLRQAGATPASLYLGIMTQAARHLGDLWDQDRCDFASVTIAMGRLQQALRAISLHFQAGSIRRAETQTILLVPAPGEQHSFGLVMLAEFFGRDGWHIAGGPATTARDAAHIAQRTWIDVAGFSIGSTARLDDLAHCIRGVRRASHNPNLHVMIGGPLVLARPDLVGQVGADATATDADGAVRQARALLAIQASAAD